MSEGEQLERLARRINWLDRYRRPLAISSAAVLTPLVVWWFHGWLPPNWPVAHLVMIAIGVAAFAWYGIETLYGFLIALWETDYAKLTRPAGLPRAEIVRRIRGGGRK